MNTRFNNIELRVPHGRFTSWDNFVDTTPPYSIGLEVIDDTPGHRGHHVHFDHHSGVVREATMSAAMQAYVAVRQGRLMERWLSCQQRIPVYTWNADQDVCLAAFVLEHHQLFEQKHPPPVLTKLIQFQNLLDVCGGLFPVDLDEMVRCHYTWVFEPYLKQRTLGKTPGDHALITEVVEEVCGRLLDLINGGAGVTPITAEPQILYESPYNFTMADEKGDPNSRLILRAQGHQNLINLVATRPNGRYTYSVIRGSPYDNDVFQISTLLAAFQASEDFPYARIWGGSNMAAGCDSELGSCLHWTKLRDIAEPIIKEASSKMEEGLRSPRWIEEVNPI